MRKPYVIVSPQFDPTSGGVRVMWGLYGWLLSKGQIAYINEKPMQGDFIAIYPEIEHGNPTNASTVVRYILAKPGEVDAIYASGIIKKGPTDFNANDEMYYFSKLCGKAKDEDHYLFLPILDLHTFKDQGKKRTDTAYLVGKGIKNMYVEGSFIHPDKSIMIDRGFAQNQQALADLLNTCHTLYCYDYRTAMTELARLCGCRVIVVNDFYTKKEFSEYEPSMNGINWGKDEGIELDTPKFREHYMGMVDLFSKRLDKFIDRTQEIHNGN